MTSTLRGVDEHRIAPLLTGGQKIRLGELQTGVDLPLYENALSGLLYGNVKFQGSGIDPKSFSAEGKVNVNEGYLSEVPS